MAMKKPMVLIAEDEDDLLELYCVSLKSRGFEVLQSRNGKEALESLRKNAGKVDLVLLDIVMPEMDGFETLENIKKDGHLRGIPIIISTNLDDDEDQEQAKELGADGYFMKSKHTPSELADEIETILRGKSEIQ